MGIVFVHGRSQQHFEPSILHRAWVDALWAGGSRAGLSKVSAAQLLECSDLPFYASLLARHETSSADNQYRSAGLTNALEREYFDELGDTRISDPDLTNRGLQNSAPFVSLLRWMDGLSPESAKAIIRKITRDVGIYLEHSEVRRSVDEIVYKSLIESTDPLIVVAHSLGTIVAYNVIANRLRDRRVKLLVTLGSPLGVRCISRTLSNLILWPTKIDRWVNFSDPLDIVALRPALDRRSLFLHECGVEAQSSKFLGKAHSILNYVDVVNDTDNHHGISGYLKDPVVADEILAAFCAGEGQQ